MRLPEATGEIITFTTDRVPGISQRMLTLDLRALEDAGLVKRTVFPEVPVKVEYRLTDDGQRLQPVVAVMKDFGLWLKSRR